MRQEARRKLARSSKWAGFIMASSALTACGGGGGDGGGNNAAYVDPAQTEVLVPVATEPTDGPAAPEDPALAPAPGSEPVPSLDEPQPGSTAAIGQGNEGVYYGALGGGSPMLMMVGPANDITGNSGDDWIWGSLDTQGSSWTFSSQTVGRQGDGELRQVTGSGTLFAREAMIVRYEFEGDAKSTQGVLNYGAENALAVDQASVAGTWESTGEDGIGITLTVDGAGAVTGASWGSAVGVCSLAGSLLQREPGTLKNAYTVELVANDAAQAGETPCQLDPLPYAGPALISLKGAGKYDANGYYRSLAILARNDQYGWIKQVLDRQRAGEPSAISGATGGLAKLQPGIFSRQ